MHEPVRMVDRQVWRDGGVSEGARAMPEETALALTYNGGTYAVMMGTPRGSQGFCRRIQPERRHRPIARRDRRRWKSCISMMASSCGCGLRNRKRTG